MLSDQPGGIIRLVGTGSEHAYLEESHLMESNLEADSIVES